MFSPFLEVTATMKNPGTSPLTLLALLLLAGLPFVLQLRKFVTFAKLAERRTCGSEHNLIYERAPKRSSSESIRPFMSFSVSEIRPAISSIVSFE